MTSTSASKSIQPFSFGRGRTGKARLTTHKDRPGYLPRPKTGELELISDPDTELITWQITLADREQNNDTFRPTCLMERVSRYLEGQAEPVSRNNVEKDVQGQAKAIRTALNTLTAEGYFAEQSGPAAHD